MAPSPPSTMARSAVRLDRSWRLARSTATTSPRSRRLGSRRSTSSGTPVFDPLPKTKNRMAPPHSVRRVRRASLTAHRGSLRPLLPPERPPDRGADAVDVQTQAGEQLAALAVFDEVVGDAEADDTTGVQPGHVGRLQHGRTKTAFERPLFDRHDQRQVLDG